MASIIAGTKRPKHSRRAIAGRRARRRTFDMAHLEIGQVITKLQAGLPFRFLESFQSATQLPMDSIADLLRIPQRTLTRRRNEDRLQPQESERLYRLVTLFEKTVDLFESDRPAAMRWLQSPQPALAGQTPLQFSRTEIGAKEVEDLIGRLEHGVFT